MGPRVAPIEASAVLRKRLWREKWQFWTALIGSVIIVTLVLVVRLFGYEPPHDVPPPPSKAAWTSGSPRPLPTPSGYNGPLMGPVGENAWQLIPSVFEIGDRFQVRDDWIMEVSACEVSLQLRCRCVDLVKVGDPSVTFEFRESQVVSLVKASGGVIYKTNPAVDRTINDAEIKAFLEEGSSVPPTWQPNGNGWEYTGRRHITAAYWEQLRQRDGYRIEKVKLPDIQDIKPPKLKQAEWRRRGLEVPLDLLERQYHAQVRELR